MMHLLGWMRLGCDAVTNVPRLSTIAQPRGSSRLRLPGCCRARIRPYGWAGGEKKMKRISLVIGGMTLLVSSFTAPALADPQARVSMTFREAAHPNFIGGCPVFPDGFCGSGEVIPFGQASETIAFGAGCGGACDLRTITLAQGQILLEETAEATCALACRPGPLERVTATLADEVVGGTGLFEGATGELTGTVMGAVSNARPAGASVVRLEGTVRYSP